MFALSKDLRKDLNEHVSCLQKTEKKPPGSLNDMIDSSPFCIFPPCLILTVLIDCQFSIGK